MPCQVPVANFPPEIGMLTLAPISDDLICAYHHPTPPSDQPLLTHSDARKGNTHRHIVRPFGIMPVDTLPSYTPRGLHQPPAIPNHRSPAHSLARQISLTFILLHDPIQRIAHVRPDVLVPVLVHAQCAARVLEEEVEQAAFYA